LLRVRFREDCRKLAYFVSRIEALITETEDETDMTAPGWEETFSVSLGPCLMIGFVSSCLSGEGKLPGVIRCIA